MIWVVIMFFLLCVAGTIFLILHEFYRFRWLLTYIQTPPNRFIVPHSSTATVPIDVYIALCDHCRPFAGEVSQEIAELRVVTWCREYTRIAQKHVDISGNHPIHTFFYSETDYNPQFLDDIYRICKTGLTDVEILLDHNHDTPANLRRKLEEFRDVLFHHHGLLRKNLDGKITYGFIHGDWALNNARPDGKWCGVSQEIPLLVETGCYADFTFPSAPDITQPPVINKIYYASALPGKAASHEKEISLMKGIQNKNALLCIQGPLTVLISKNFFSYPLIDRGEISYKAKFTHERFNAWMRRAPRIPGADNSIFIKLFTNGMIDQNIRYLFSDEGLDLFWTTLENLPSSTIQYRIHYVSAWEMYNKIFQNCTSASSNNYNKQRI